MKRITAAILCLLMVVTMAACGSKEAEEKVEAPVSAIETVVAAAQEAEPLETTASPEETTAAPTETEAVQEVQFDTSWAGNEFEMLLPKPPFDDWTAETKNPVLYELWRENSADWEDEAAWEQQRDDFYAYVNGLVEYGFTLDAELYRGNTQVRAFDRHGNRFDFTDYASEFMITIVIKE